VDSGGRVRERGGAPGLLGQMKLRHELLGLLPPVALVEGGGRCHRDVLGQHEVLGMQLDRRGTGGGAGSGSPSPARAWRIAAEARRGGRDRRRQPQRQRELALELRLDGRLHDLEGRLGLFCLGPFCLGPDRPRGPSRRDGPAQQRIDLPEDHLLVGRRLGLR